MSLAGFEPTIPASKWTQSYALECVATGIGIKNFLPQIKKQFIKMDIYRAVRLQLMTCGTFNVHFINAHMFPRCGMYFFS